MNTELITAEIINAECLPITTAQILEYDFENDDEAEFLQSVIQIQAELYDLVYESENPELFLIPTEEENLSPAEIMIEKLEELKSYRFGSRTLARMERIIRNENTLNPRRLTETEKASHPDYVKCPECLRHFIKPYLGHHMGTAICLKVKTAHNLRPTSNDKKKVSEKIYNACLDLEDLYARAVEYRKNIEPDLEPEEYVTEDECVYVIKTWEFNRITGNIDYAGLWEDSESGNKEFKTEEEAREAFGYATEGDKGFTSVELIRIDPNSEERETIIDDWEDNTDLTTCIACGGEPYLELDIGLICEECNKMRIGEDGTDDDDIGYQLRFHNARYLYKIKVWDEGDYIGLYKDADGECYWKTRDEADYVFRDATYTSGSGNVLKLVKIWKYNPDEEIVCEWDNFIFTNYED